MSCADRFADSDFDRSAPRKEAAFAEDLVSTANQHRHDIASGAQREVSGTALEILDSAVSGARPLGKHQHRAACREFAECFVERLELRTFTVERNHHREVRGEKPSRARVEEIILGCKYPEIAAERAERVAEEAEIKMARVIRHDEEVAVRGNIAAAENLRLQPRIEREPLAAPYCMPT